MSTKSEIGAELRRRTYQYGPSVYRTVQGERDAHRQATDLTLHYRSEGLGFTVGEKIPGEGAYYPVIANAVPFLTDDTGGDVPDERVAELVARGRKWGVVLVRALPKATNASSMAHRQNKLLTTEGRFRSRRVGASAMSGGGFGVFYVHGESADDE